MNAFNTFLYDVIKWKHFPRYCPFVWGTRWIPHTNDSNADLLSFFIVIRSKLLNIPLTIMCPMIPGCMHVVNRAMLNPTNYVFKKYLFISLPCYIVNMDSLHANCVVLCYIHFLSHSIAYILCYQVWYVRFPLVLMYNILENCHFAHRN